MKLPFFLLFATCAVAQQRPADVTITGQVRNATLNGYVYLESTGQPPKRLDSARLNDQNRFTLRSRVADGGGFYVLNFAGAQKAVVLLEGGETLQVTADGFQKNPKTGEVGRAQITGSANADNYAKLMSLKESMDARTVAWNKQYEAAVAKKDDKTLRSIEQQFQAAQVETVQKVKAMLPGMGTSLAALVATNFLSAEDDFPTLDSLARKFEKAGNLSPQAQAFVGHVTRLRGVSIGGQAPDIALNDTTGKPVALSSLRGKYVLIDFWASWCGPCRQENPNVVRMYNQYKDKGFTIYSVSLDRPGQREAWVRAIRNDKLTWTHVSDLKFWQSAAAQQYGVQAIPATFLLDPQGNIIAKNLRGDALEAKLAELLEKKAP